MSGPVWPDLAKVYKFLANFECFFLFGKMLSQFWHICDILGLIFIVANGQILKNNLTIWSHWSGLMNILSVFLVTRLERLRHDYFRDSKLLQYKEVVVAQLVERSLLIPEVRGSNPVIGKNLFIYWTIVYCQLCKDKNKEKEAENGPRKKVSTHNH